MLTPAFIWEMCTSIYTTGLGMYTGGTRCGNFSAVRTGCNYFSDEEN